MIRGNVGQGGLTAIGPGDGNVDEFRRAEPEMGFRGILRYEVVAKETHDEFLPGPELVRRSGYVINEKSGTVNYNIPFDKRNYTKSPL